MGGKIKRHPSHRRVKIHRSYSVEEIADLYGIHKNTVRQWIKAGLPTIDTKRPMLIHGKHLSEFLMARHSGKKRPCNAGEIYCMKCRSAKAPAGRMADLVPLTSTLAVLKGLCPDCHCMINRHVNSAKFALIRGELEIKFMKAPERVGNTA